MSEAHLQVVIAHILSPLAAIVQAGVPVGLGRLQLADAGPSQPDKLPRPVQARARHSKAVPRAYTMAESPPTAQQDTPRSRVWAAVGRISRICPVLKCTSLRTGLTCE